MELTPGQQALLDGSRGPAMAKVVRTLVMYGECFGARRMVEVTGARGHLVTSFGLSMLKPVYDLMDELVAGGAVSGQEFSADPRPLDPAVPANPLQRLVFKVMYSKQADYEAQLGAMGLMGGDSFTCTCYMPEVGNRPGRGDVLSWAESSAVVFANSVLGARCNRNSGIIEMFGSIAGFVPEFGLLTDEGRRATWVVEVACEHRPEPQVLGSAIGMRVMEEVPYIKGLDRWLGDSLDRGAEDYLKDMGAAAASNGAVGLYHVDGLTPRPSSSASPASWRQAPRSPHRRRGTRARALGYPVMWKRPADKPKLCFIGCPHLSSAQLADWSDRIVEGLAARRKRRVQVPTVLTAAPAVARSPRGPRPRACCRDEAPSSRASTAHVQQPAVRRPHPHGDQLQQAAHLLHGALLHRRRGAGPGDPRPRRQEGRRPLMPKVFKGRVVVPGTASAEALVSHGGLNTLASFQKALMFGDGEGHLLGPEQPRPLRPRDGGQALCHYR